MVNLQPVLHAHLLRAHLARVRVNAGQLFFATSNRTLGLFVNSVVIAGVTTICSDMTVKRDVRVFVAVYPNTFGTYWTDDDLQLLTARFGAAVS